MQETLSGMLEVNYAASISLAHGLNQLQIYGLKTFFSYLEKINKGEVGGRSLKSMLIKIPAFSQIYEYLKDNIDTLSTYSIHPKYPKLLEVIEEHLSSHKDTRIIIFSQLRSSVDEIVSFLSNQTSQIRPCAFIGQSKIVGSDLNYNQRKQIEVITRAKSNKCRDCIV